MIANISASVKMSRAMWLVHSCKRGSNCINITGCVHILSEAGFHYFDISEFKDDFQVDLASQPGVRRKGI